MMPLVRQQLTNVALACIALAACIAVIATRSQITTSELRARDSNLLTAWRRDEVQRLEIERSTEHVVLERKPSGDAGSTEWLITSPARETADAYAVDKLLNALDLATWIRRIEPSAVERGEFGLDTPASVLRVHMGSISYRVSIGKAATAPAGAVYVEISGDGAANT